LFIHTDKTKTKAKEADERERQRQGQAPSKLKIGKRYTAHLEDSPGVLIASTHSGSMTQEIFFHFVNHFLESRPTDAGPAILLLDGHGSRWSVQALRRLIQNKVYPFFIASHTSIWAQPNDAGVNKRYHWSIEEACKKLRRRKSQANVSYYNQILRAGWTKFLEQERTDLRELGINNTTNAYARTGAYPLDPFCSAWTIAINTLGLDSRENKTKVSYEVVLKTGGLPELTDKEMLELKEGLVLDPTIEAFGRGAVAVVRGEEILKKWRSRIDQAVSEGADYEEYAAILLPSAVVKTDSEKIAMKLLDFQLVDIKKINLPEPDTKKEKAKKLSENIVTTAHISDAIKVAYLGGDEKNADDEFWVPGNALKMPDNKWQVVLNTGKQILISELELLDSKRWYVKKAFNNLNRLQKKKQDQKSIRQRKLEQAEMENTLARKARQERKENDREEFKLLMKMIDASINQDDLVFTFCDFSAMAERLRAPFRTEIDGHMVTVTENEKAIMMKDSALEVIKTTILGEKRDLEEGENMANKKARTNTAAVPTGKGQNGLGAVQFTNGRDVRQNKEARRKKIASLTAEEKTINKTLSMIVERKARCETEWAKLERQRHLAAVAATTAAATVSRQQEEQHGRRTNEIHENTSFHLLEMEIVTASSESERESQSNRASHDTGKNCASQVCTVENPTGPIVANAIPTGATDPVVANGIPTGATGSVVGNGIPTGATGSVVANGIPTGATGNVANPTGDTSAAVAAAETYWEPRATSRGDDLKLFLRLFEPTSGTLSKRKPEQWAFILEKIVPRLSEAAFIAKEQAIRRRLDATVAELKELNEVAEDPEEDIDETENRTSDTNN
jgi:hypothetical protein